MPLRQHEHRQELDRLELGDAKWNEAALGRSFLDAKQYPVVTFVSTQVTPVDATHAKVKGKVTLRGVTREVELDVVFHQAKRHPMPPFRHTAGFSATTKLSRKAFGIDAWPTVIGDEVELRIEAEAVRGAAEDNATAPQTAPSGQEPTTPVESTEPVPEPTPTP